MSYRRYWDLPDDTTGVWAARRRLAAAIRDLSDRCITTEVTEQALLDAAAQVEALVQRLPAGRDTGAHWRDGTYQQDVTRFIDRTALMGQANPTAPPMVVRREDTASVCTIVLGERFVGAPGLCHGGVIAAIYDQLLGHAVIWADRSGLTVDLQITYRRPTPLHVPLRFAATVTEAAGRRTVVSGTCHQGETLLSTCVGHFVRLSPQKARDVFGPPST